METHNVLATIFLLWFFALLVGCAIYGLFFRQLAEQSDVKTDIEKSAPRKGETRMTFVPTSPEDTSNNECSQKGYRNSFAGLSLLWGWRSFQICCMLLMILLGFDIYKIDFIPMNWESRSKIELTETSWSDKAFIDNDDGIAVFTRQGTGDCEIACEYVGKKILKIGRTEGQDEIDITDVESLKAAWKDRNCDSEEGCRLTCDAPSHMTASNISMIFLIVFALSHITQLIFALLGDSIAVFFMMPCKVSEATYVLVTEKCIDSSADNDSEIDSWVSRFWASCRRKFNKSGDVRRTLHQVKNFQSVKTIDMTGKSWESCSNSFKIHDEIARRSIMFSSRNQIRYGAVKYQDRIVTHLNGDIISCKQQLQRKWQRLESDDDEQSSAKIHLTTVYPNRYFEFTCIRYIWSDAHQRFKPYRPSCFSGHAAIETYKEGGLVQEQVDEQHCYCGPNNIEVEQKSILKKLSATSKF
jgi:hypothetical protein